MREFSATARSVGILSAVAVVGLLLGYGVTLAVGLLSLETPLQPIRDPMFSILEILIILISPPLVALMLAVHAWAPTHTKILALMSVVFMSLVAGLTCGVHFVVLTLTRQEAFAWSPLFLSFTWPSVVYALDILAWDFLFPISMFSAAGIFSGRGLPALIRVSMIASGTLALAGLSGVVAGDMRLRNIGIIGYVPVFLVVVALTGILFYRTTPASTPSRERAGSPEH
jgi:hypothetical protein